MRKDKQKKESSFFSLLPLAQVFLVGAAAFVLFLIFVVIFMSAERLGVLFFPALFAYFAVLALVGAYLYHRKELFTMNYSQELKEAMLRRMLPPNNESITKISNFNRV